VHETAVAGTVSDDFNRADGGLGSGWTASSDGGLSISSQVVAGSSATAGDVRTGEAYGSDQFSQVEVTSTQLTNGRWLGAGVRLQGSGQNGYVGLYFWNYGSPQLMVFKRSNGSWAQLGASVATAALPAGTQLRLSVTGSALSFLVNGSQKVAVSDASFTGGGFDGSTLALALTKEGDQWKLDEITAIPHFDLQAFEKAFTRRLVTNEGVQSQAVGCITNALNQAGPTVVKAALISGNSTHLLNLIGPCLSG